MKKLLTIVMALAFAIQLSAQTLTTVVGDSTATTSAREIPAYVYYNHSYSQSVYTASELGFSGEIKGIGYYHSSTQQTFNSGTWKIYMKEVSESEPTSFLPTDGFVEVYSGAVTLPQETGCVMLNLTTPFTYSGGANLAVVVVRDGSYDNHHYFVTTSGNALLYYDDYDAVSITAPPTSGNGYSRAVTKFEYEVPEGFCFPVSNLVASDILQNSASISWTADETATNFGVAYKKLSEEEWTVATENTTSLYWSLAGLDSYTEYQAKVWSICPEDNSMDKIVNFMTLPTADNFISIPYSENFDDIDAFTGWTAVNIGTENKWVIGTALNNTIDEADEPTDGGALYISNDNGVSNACTANGNSAITTHIYSLINIEEGNFYSMTFDHKLNTSSSYTQVSLVPLNYEFTSSLPADSYKIDTVKNAGDNWRNVFVEIPGNTTPGAYKLVFSYYRGGYSTGTPPAAIDNLEITSTNCAKVTDFTHAFSEDGTSVTMTVDVNDIINEDAEYLVEYKVGTEADWNSVQSTTPVTITDLPYNSKITYRVTAMCFGEEAAIPSEQVSVFTPCNIISEFPWNAELNDWHVAEGASSAFRNAPSCWFNINGGASGFYFTSNTQSNTTINYSGAYGTSTSQFSDWMITPAFELTGGERLMFNYALNSAYYGDVPYPHIDIYALNIEENDFTYAYDTSDFVLLQSVYNPTLTTQGSLAEISLTELSGSYRLAFAVRECSQSFKISNIQISEMPSCPDLYGFTASLSATDAVAVSYQTNNITDAGVLVSYAAVEEGETFDPNSGTTILIALDDELPIEIDGLDEGTTYQFAAQQACDGAWSEVIEITTPIVYGVPFSATFDTEETTPIVITESDNNTNKWFIGTAANNTTEVENGGALYVSADNGTTAGYNNSTATDAYASILLSFEEGAEFDISFDYKAGGETYTYDYLRAYLVPFGEDINETEHALIAKKCSTNGWLTQTTTKPALRGIYSLVFYWYNDDMSGNSPAAIIDNISVTSRPCTGGIPVAITFAENEEGNNIVVDIDDQFNSSPSYILKYKTSTASEYTAITDLTAEDFPYSIDDNIEFSTTYNIQVVVICNGEELPATTHSFTTPCGKLGIPWSEDFTVDPLTSDCWTQRSELLPEDGVISFADMNNGGGWGRTTRSINGVSTTAAKINIYGTDNKSWMFTPIFDLNDASRTYQISFDVALTDWNSSEAPEETGADDKLIVFASTDGGETWDITNALVFADGDDDTEHNFSALTNQLQRYSFKLVDSEENPLSGNVRFAFYTESTIGNNGDNDLFIDNLVVDEWSACPNPYNLEVNNTSITSTSATFSFASMQASGWEYVVVEGTDADPASGTPIATFTTNNVVATDLEPETIYTLAVRSVCEGDLTSNWLTTTFNTLPDATAVPYQTSFSEETANIAWVSTSSSTNAWTVGTATATEEEGKAAYISNNGSNYAATRNYNSTTAHLWKEFSFGETTESFELSFDWKVRGRRTSSGFNGGISVYLVDATVTPGTSTLSNPIVQLEGSDSWQNERVYLGNITGDKRLVFTATGYTTDDELIAPAAIDNINVFVSTCSPIDVASVEVPSVETTSATITWSDTDETHTSWNLYYKSESDNEYTVVVATETTFEINGLTPATPYSVYVTTNCGEDESIASETVSFTTECDIIETFPYHEGFESTPLTCWTSEIVSGTANWGMATSYSGGIPATEGEEFIIYKATTREISARLTSPVFDLTSLSSPYVKFDYLVKAWSGDIDEFKVQYRTDETAEWVDLLHHTTSVDTWTNDSLALPNASSTYQISILAISDYGYGVAIDNLFVYDADAIIEEPEVIAPVVTTLAATAVDHQGATLNGTITAGSEEITAQGFMYKATAATDWTTVNATGTTISATLSALTAETEYTFKAFATTASGTVEGTAMTFTTTAAPIVAPVVTTLAATAVDHESATLNGTITAGSETITAQGFMYKATAAADWTTVNATGTTISATLSALTAETEYTFKAFATTASGTVEGTAMTFTTTAAPIVAPVVTTLAATAVDHESAVLNGTITAGSETITAQGFMYKATAAADWTTVNATGTTISATLTALTAETEYTFKAFATTASGTVEGTAMTFTTTATPIVAPTVVTLAATEITNATAKLNGTVTAGSEEIVAQGFMYKASNAADWTTVAAVGETMSLTVEGL
ncbi:MAG: fibronectin type III domain-containing protein [Bacteroidales bacterium]|nr:fibronectin type III domain-containing protein [Bacteroidales bacterium]